VALVQVNLRSLRLLLRLKRPAISIMQIWLQQKPPRFTSPTMDPFTAIGLAASIITFIDFGFEVVSAAREIYDSNSGATSENKDLESLTCRVNNLALNLQPKKSTSQMTDDERNLNDLAAECTRLSHDVLDLLKDLKARKTGSTKESLRAVWRNISTRKKKTELEKKLEKCRQLLHLQLTSTAR
jgi:hypothetical protein